ncbi:Receptor-like protein kinase HSL1 [Gossypium arboreum]|uniref:Receptor-like protein kinase HSL1 n=1 Tax=Gossypium arboreum TaxID=29729 RepID=A0A0B0MTE3_GOSAR|nr:Receptor-like protein kinase HSL1 [Gossypium arboreum]
MARLFTLLFLFFPVLNLSFCKTLKRDVKALNEIKASLGWRVVYAWVGDDPCGDGNLPPWSGITCTLMGDYRVVTELEVYAVSIVGPFPVPVTNLFDLTRLDMHNNKLTGPIPPQIERLKRLKILYLSFNNFKGEIPKELASLPELRYLHLHQNRFSGRIPAELGTLEKLQHLDVGNNHLVGTIKQLISMYGCFPSLRNLYLNNNYLTGGFPAKIAGLTNLEILHLDHNQFAGRIPEALYRHPFVKEMQVFFYSQFWPSYNSYKKGAKSIGVPKILELADSEFLV